MRYLLTVESDSSPAEVEALSRELAGAISENGTVGMVGIIELDGSENRIPRTSTRAFPDLSALLNRIRANSASVLLGCDTEGTKTQDLAADVIALDVWLSDYRELPGQWRRPIVSCSQCGGDMTGNVYPDTGLVANHLVSPDTKCAPCPGTGKPPTEITFG